MAGEFRNLLSTFALIPRMPSFRFSHEKRTVRDAGFTLIELLVVLSIMALLAVATMPSLEGLISSANLRGGANSVVAELDLARQTASARNLPVEVRCYQDTAKPKDTNGNYPYHIIALVIPMSASGAASDEFVAQPLFLSGDVVIDSNPQYSSGLNVGLGAAGLQPAGATELASAPYALRNLPYIKFTFLANGTINLDPTQQWCLTLLNGNKARPPSAGSTPAANFVALILDTQTGRARVYQP
jgi:uncharacterized protein (TIGR02596 family)